MLKPLRKKQRAIDKKITKLEEKIEKLEEQTDLIMDEVIEVQKLCIHKDDGGFIYGSCEICGMTDV